MVFRWSAGTAIAMRCELAESGIQEERHKKESIGYIGELGRLSEGNLQAVFNDCFGISISDNQVTFGTNKHYVIFLHRGPRQWDSI